MIWPWALPRDRMTWPGAPPAPVWAESCLVPGCSSGSGRRPGSPCCRHRPGAGKRCYCGPGSASGGWRTAPRGFRWGAASRIRSGSGCRCSARCAIRSAGSGLVRELTAAPDLDGWAVVERLLKDLAPLADRLWLVIDDVHELRSADALAQLELLVMRAPPELRFVLATRHDLRLGLHRLRLEGELSEIRTADLQFTQAEARELLTAAGVALPEPALAMLHERAEGWAAGLRLAALSLAGHEDPERFAAEFSGSERTVADYLLAEVLERQPDEVRRLLLRTSVLERVSGPLADALTGGSGGERMLAELEQANAFVVSLDAGRSWFRYHHLFADLLQLALRRTAPGEVTALHEAAAGWLAEHGFPVEAIRPRAGGAGLGPGRPAARRQLARPAPGRAGRHRARNPGRVPRRGHCGGCRAGHGGGGG